MANRSSRSPTIPVPSTRSPPSSSSRNLSISDIIHLPQMSSTSPSRDRARPSSTLHRPVPPDAYRGLSSSLGGQSNAVPTSSRTPARSNSASYSASGRGLPRWSSFEPRVVRGTSHGAEARSPPSAPLAQARRASTTSLRLPVPQRATSNPSDPAIDPSSAVFQPPAYLEHSSLRHLIQTEAHQSLPPSRYTLDGAGMEIGVNSLYGMKREHTPVSPVTDSDDEDIINATRPAIPPRTDSSFLSNPVLKLPTRWNDQDRQSSLSVSPDGRDLTFQGTTRDENSKEAAAARSDHPIPAACGIYYYEVKILSKGLKGHISVGLCNSDVKLSRLPGWERYSWGYHGDDGNSFAGEKTGSSYGPTFGTGDVIGCGIDFSQNRAFYTKNGTFIGMVFEDVGKDCDLYPSVGLRTSGEAVRVNFGQDPFLFVIGDHVGQQRNQVWASIQTTPIRWTIDDSANIFTIEAESLPDLKPAPSRAILASKELSEEIKAPEDFRTPINKLVLSYLAHHGYSRTALALQAQCGSQVKETRWGTASSTHNSTRAEEHHMDMDMDDIPSTSVPFDGLGPGMHEADVQSRTRIVNAVTSGDVDTALKETRAHHPDVLEREEGLMLFKLRCQKFVELILESGEALKRVKAEEQDAIAKASAGGADSMIAMDVDDERAATVTNGFSNGAPTSAIPIKGKRKSSMRLSVSPATAQYQSALAKALSYGKTLQVDYGKDPRQDVQTIYKRTFNLVAFDDPLEARGEVKEVAGQDARVRLASELNLAILESQGRPSQPALERLYRHTAASIVQLGLLGVGAAAFADMSKEFLEDA